jgi:ubiquinone/menaquinone biosynthesis C-methylase UbiE
MDAKALEFADNSLDMVISTGSLHHWKDPLRIINEAYRCLKPQGEAWIYDGYAEAADGDIQRSIHKFLGFFPSNGIIRQILSIHGYSQAGYDTMVKDIVAESRFKACFFEKRGVMMRLRMKK